MVHVDPSLAHVAQFGILLEHVGQLPPLKYLPLVHLVHVFAVWEHVVHPVIVEHAAHPLPLG